MSDLTRQCFRELSEIFQDMKYALTIGQGDKAFRLLIRLILDKYPPETRVEACQSMMDILKKEMEEGD